jgi:hypothetical protein
VEYLEAITIFVEEHELEMEKKKKNLTLFAMITILPWLVVTLISFIS